MTSLDQAVVDTGRIPPISADSLKPPAGQPDAPKDDKPGSEASLVEKQSQDIEARIRKLDATNPPPPPEFKEAPKFETSDPVGQGYVSAIGVLGAIGSMFTRRPMINSMNSAAAVMSAMKAGDQQAYKQNFEKWKIDNDNIKALSDYQQGIYKDILENSKAGIDAKMGMLQAHAAAFKDDVMAQHMKNQDYQSAEQLVLDREKATHTWEKERAEAEKLGIENGAKLEEYNRLKEDFQTGHITKEQYMQGLQGLATNKVVGNTPTLSQSAIDRAAHQLNMGDKSVLQNMGRQAGGAANIQAIRDRAAELADEEGVSPEEISRRSQRFLGDNAGQRTLSNRVASISAAGAAVGEVPTKDNPGSGAAKLAVEASRKVPRGKFVPLNEAVLTGKKAVSDPELAQLVVYTNTLINEYSNATNPTGRGTVSDKTHARELISKAQDPEAYEAAVRAMVKEKDNSLAKAKEAKAKFLSDEGTESSKQTDFPTPPPEAVQMLKDKPETADQFDEMFGEGAADAVLNQ